MANDDIYVDSDKLDPELLEFLTEIFEEPFWKDVRKAARKDPQLQEALDRVKILYHLKNDNGK